MRRLFTSGQSIGSRSLARRITGRLVGTASLVLVALFGLIPVTAEERTVKRILETREGLVDLSIVDGTGATSYISTGDEGRVIVRATITGFAPHSGRPKARKTLEELVSNPPIEQQGNTIQIGGLPWRVRKDLSISYHVTVPPNTNVHANGPETVHVLGLVGNLNVIGANVIASKILGNVTLVRAKKVRVTDLSGNLHVTGGWVVASKIQGDVHLTRAEYVSIEDVSGRVSVTDRAQVVGLDKVLVDLGAFGN